MNILATEYALELAQYTKLRYWSLFLNKFCLDTLYKMAFTANEIKI